MTSATTKKCSKCEENLPTTQFHKNALKADGLQIWCKDCRSKHKKAYKLARRLRNAELNKKWHDDSREKYNDRKKLWRADNKALIRSYRRKHKYGITEEQYQTLVKKQDNKCSICKRVIEQLRVDHCHATGIVRGLLCAKCNAGIGFFDENVEYLSAAIEYIRNFQKE